MTTASKCLSILEVWQHPQRVPTEHGVYVFRRLTDEIWNVIPVGAFITEMKLSNV